MKALVMSLVILGNVVAATAQSSLQIDSILPVARILRTPSTHKCIPEFEGYRRPWIYLLAKYDTATLVRTDDRIWRFLSTDDTVNVHSRRPPQRTLLDANGDGHRDFYDTLLVLGTGSGWQPDTLALPDNRDKRTVSDLNADGYDDLIMHYQGDSLRVYWGDSALPLRESSLIINPDHADHEQDAGFGKNPRIEIVDVLQGRPMILTVHDVDLNLNNGDDGKYKHWMGWKMKVNDVAQRSGTLNVDRSMWHDSYWVWEHVAPIPVINRSQAWVGHRYRDWVAYDTTGRFVLEEQAPDTLVLSSSQIAASLMLPLNHPPTLDSTLVLYVSTGNVLSVSEWLTPADVIPSETRAYYLTPQTINSTKIVELMMWPDMTGDSIPELGVYREPDDTLVSRLDYCFEIYDIAGAMVSSVVMPRDHEPDTDVTVRDGRIVWSTAAGDRVSVRVHDATGRLLETKSAPTSEITTTGIELGDRGRGLRLVELVDGMGHVRRITVLVQ